MTLRDLHNAYKRHHAQWCVEGKYFETVKQIFRIAQKKGFNGCTFTLTTRLKRGATTWEELCKPVNPKLVNHHPQKREQLTELCADLDKRKAALLTFECCCENGARLGVKLCPECEELWANQPR